jgi:drug/metabolite transporter (DMT)-like permease
LPPSAFRVHAALIAVSMLFGVNYVGTKIILATVPAPSWALVRMAAATLVMVPLAIWLARGRPWPPARTWPALAFAALLGVAANQVLFTEGLARTTPEHSAVVNACIPTWTLLVAVLARQERLTRRRVLAIASALAGVLWLLGVDRMLTARAGDDRATLLGDLLTMSNGIAFACHLVWLRRVGRGLDPYHTTAILFLLGTPMMVPWCGPALTTEHLHALLVPPTVWLAAYAVIAATVFTYCLNTWALRHTSGSQVALYINLQPIVAATVNMLCGAQLPGVRFFGALALVALGLWLQARAPSAAPRAAIGR